MARALPLLKQEVIHMHFCLSQPILVIALAAGTATFAQSVPSNVSSPPLPLNAPDAGLSPSELPQLHIVTQSSRIRGFNAGPDGQILSLYLQNGSVVNVAPDLGQRLTSSVRKGERISVTGASSEIKGQEIIAAKSLTINSQNFASIAPDASDAERGMIPPPPPPPEIAGSRSPESLRIARGPLPPPPPDGPAGPRAIGPPAPLEQGRPPAPPPPPNRPEAGAPPPTPDGLAAPPAPDASQSGAPNDSPSIPPPPSL